MRTHRLTLVLTLAVTGCLPNLGGWRVVGDEEDAGRLPSRDGGPTLRVPDCTSPIPLGAGYREGFEEGPGGWGVSSESEVEGQRASWEWGRPEGERITRAAEGERVFATRLAEPYENGEQSLLVSPCFDASSARHDLLVSLSWTAYTERCCDRLSLEYTVDGGATWEVAGGERRIGWYEGATGWSGEHDWTRGSTLLPGTAGRSAVQVRLRFRSDTSGIGGDGVAIDDVELRAAAFDLAVSVEEAARCGWTEATVTNVGGLPVTGFEIRGDVDGVPSATPYDRELRYLDTQVLEVGGPLASVTTATVFTVGDEDSSNDTASMRHSSQPFTGYFSDFEADDGGLFVMGEPSSWEWGVPAGTLIRSAASGSRAWMTRLDGDYGHNERGALMLPCYDMRALSRDPSVSLSRVYDTEPTHDYGVVEVSIDGADFVAVGSSSSGGTGWYPISRGWSGSSGAGLWAPAQHPLTGAAGGGAVRVRVRFHSDGSTSGEGVGIDDLAIDP